MQDADVQAAYDERCRTYMVEDVRRGIHDAKANYLVALGIFSYLEVLGGLLSGNGAMRSSATANFNEVVKHLPQPYQDLDAKLEVTGSAEGPQKGLYGVFRCGLVHEYAPKGRVMVYNNPGREPDPTVSGVEVENDAAGPRLVVNNNELFRDFEDLVNTVGGYVDSRDATYFPRIKAVFERFESYSIKV
jgi:hypothetical protein